MSFSGVARRTKQPTLSKEFEFVHLPDIGDTLDPTSRR